jgi:hypothetical protein
VNDAAEAEVVGVASAIRDALARRPPSPADLFADLIPHPPALMLEGDERIATDLARRARLPFP